MLINASNAFAVNSSDFAGSKAAQLIIRAGKLAGITRVGDKAFHPHHIRHSHSIAYIRGDSSIEGLRKLQMRLGHTSISTTGHYLNFSQRGEAKKIEEIFGGSS